MPPRVSCRVAALPTHVRNGPASFTFTSTNTFAASLERPHSYRRRIGEFPELSVPPSPFASPAPPPVPVDASRALDLWPIRRRTVPEQMHRANRNYGLLRAFPCQVTGRLTPRRPSTKSTRKETIHPTYLSSLRLIRVRCREKVCSVCRARVKAGSAENAIAALPANGNCASIGNHVLRLL